MPDRVSSPRRVCNSPGRLSCSSFNRTSPAQRGRVRTSCSSPCSCICTGWGNSSTSVRPPVDAASGPADGTCSARRCSCNATFTATGVLRALCSPPTLAWSICKAPVLLMPGSSSVHSSWLSRRRNCSSAKVQAAVAGSVSAGSVAVSAGCNGIGKPASTSCFPCGCGCTAA